MGILNIQMAQFNPIIGDFMGNAAKIIALFERAAEAGADIVVTPESSAGGGYPQLDLLHRQNFLNLQAEGLEEICEASKRFPKVALVVGVVGKSKHQIGNPIQNSLVVVQDGSIKYRYNKQLLPTYLIFDEARYFKPGYQDQPSYTYGKDGKLFRIGFLICEDGWNDGVDKGVDKGERHLYRRNPVQYIAEGGVDILISINASPSNVGKVSVRESTFSDICKRHELPLVYVNQVGGQTGVIFDGNSFAMNRNGETVALLPAFQEAEQMVHFDSELKDLVEDDIIDVYDISINNAPEFFRSQIVYGIREYVQKLGCFKGFVIGESGGIDSALTTALAVEAVGAENVIAVTMPSEFSSTGSVTDSVKLCQKLGVRLEEVPIGKIFDTIGAATAEAFGKTEFGLAEENLQARIRGMILMWVSNKFPAHLVLSTGNKSEMSVGYCTIYGDMCGGVSPLSDVYKTMVFEMSRHINDTAGEEIIPWDIINKPPSAELAPGQKDTDSLPPYDVLDAILKLAIEGDLLPDDEIYPCRELLLDKFPDCKDRDAVIKRILTMIDRNEFKRQQAPRTIKVNRRSYDESRRIPIVMRYPVENYLI